MARKIRSLDVLGETRRALRVLRRIEKYLTQQERRARKAGEKRQAQFQRVQAELEQLGEQA